MTAASPQLEDGHTRIANEILEALLLARLTSRQWAVAVALIRKTYGYNKKTDDIGLSQLADLTGLAKPHVSVAVRELEERRIISRKQGKFGHIMGLNKDHVQWTGIERRAVPRVTDSVTVTETVTVTDSVKRGYRIGKAGVTDSVTTKDKPTKDIQKKATRDEVNFKTWLEKCKDEGVSPIPADHSIFDWAQKIGIPFDFVRYVWVEFKRKYGGTENKNKKYKDWSQTFSNAVRDNWYGVWYEKEGAYHLTTRGKMIEAWINSKNDEDSDSE